MEHLKIPAHGISIHALLAESDSGRRTCSGKSSLFLSTLSLRRATYGRINDISRLIFLSTLSLRRATACWTGMQSVTLHFYPRSPCGERPCGNAGIGSPISISIHALLAESDFHPTLKAILSPIFLSTLSLRRATA